MKTLFEGLKKKKDQFESELEALGSIREMNLKESEASGKISGLEKKIQYAEIEKVIFSLIISYLTFCFEYSNAYTCTFIILVG